MHKSISSLVGHDRPLHGVAKNCT